METQVCFSAAVINHIQFIYQPGFRDKLNYFNFSFYWNWTRKNLKTKLSISCTRHWSCHHWRLGSLYPPQKTDLNQVQQPPVQTPVSMTTILMKGPDSEDIFKENFLAWFISYYSFYYIVFYFIHLNVIEAYFPCFIVLNWFAVWSTWELNFYLCMTCAV